MRKEDINFLVNLIIKLDIKVDAQHSIISPYGAALLYDFTDKKRKTQVEKALTMLAEEAKKYGRTN